MTWKQRGAILIADDDPDDRLMIRDALLACNLSQSIHFAQDGEEVLDYLRGAGRFGGQPSLVRPQFILLDLNMPKKDGVETLLEIKGDPSLRKIPIIVLTTSSSSQDVARVYDLGANSFIRKPHSYQRLVELMRSISHYWLDTVELPPNHTSQSS